MYDDVIMEYDVKEDCGIFVDVIVDLLFVCFFVWVEVNEVFTVCVIFGGFVVTVIGFCCCCVGIGVGLIFFICIWDEVSVGGSGFSGLVDIWFVKGGKRFAISRYLINLKELLIEVDDTRRAFEAEKIIVKVSNEEISAWNDGIMVKIEVADG